MPYISRQVGTVSSLITLFLADRTVSTGAGLANIVASTVRISWVRSDQAAVSSWTLTTGTLGTWAGSTMTQVGSTSTLGAYQFSLPNGLFASGDNAYVQIMSSTAAFAEVPLVIELTKTDNQTYMSSQVIGSASSVRVPVGVSTLPAVSSISTPVTASSITIPVGVSTITAGVLSTHSVSSVINEGGLIHRGTAVSSTASTISLDVTLSSYANDLLTGAVVFVKGGTGAGQSRVLDDWTSTDSVGHISPNWTVNPTSTSVYEVHAAAPGSSSTFPSVTLASTSILVGVSTLTAGVNVTSIVGSAAVTSAAGVIGPVRVSSISTPVTASSVSALVGASTFTLAALSSFFTLDAGDYSTSVLGSVVQEIADNVSATVGAQVGVSSISIPVSVSSVTAAVNVSALHGSAWVTSAAGVPGPLRVSSISTPVSASSVTVPVGISTITVAAMSSFFTLDAGDYSTSVLGSVVQEIADNVSATVGAQVGVSSISIPVSVSSVTVAVNVSAVHGSPFVTSAAGVLGPSAVSSLTTPVTASSVTGAVNVTSFFGSAAVTSAAGVLGPSAVSSVTTPVTASSVTAAVNVSSLYGSGWVTSAAGVPGPVRVSSISTPVTASSVSALVGASTFTLAALSSFFTLDAGDYSTAALGSVVKEIADNVSATVGAQVGVSSISIPVSVSSVSVTVSANVVKVNNTTVDGTGQPGDEWGPA